MSQHQLLDWCEPSMRVTSTIKKSLCHLSMDDSLIDSDLGVPGYSEVVKEEFDSAKGCKSFRFSMLDQRSPCYPFIEFDA